MQKKAFRIFLTSLFAIAFALVSIFATASSIQAHAATTKTPVQQSTTKSTLPGEPSWVIKAEPYVHISNGIATVDQAIKKSLSPSDVALVMHAVQAYNALPLSAKNKGSISVHGTVTPNASCPSNGGAIYGPYHYWYGTAYTLNHCLIVRLWLAVYIGGSTATAVAIICGFYTLGACALFAALTGVYIAATVKALNDADAQCGNRGANVNFFFGVYVPVVNSVC